MRVCDWIANFLYEENSVRHIHGLMGGGASGLNDGFIKNGKLKYICYHNEQGAGHAAIGEAKFTRKVSVVNPTTGCGGTNCITSALDAWQDSVPVLFISGNVRLNSCSQWINSNKRISIRKYGVQEHNIISTVQSITKYSKFITSVQEVAYELEKAIYIAKEGRCGPVWIDIPADIQTAEMPNEVTHFYPTKSTQYFHEKEQIQRLISESERPIILAGYGIRQSNCVSSFIEFIQKYKIPYVSTYGARDYLPEFHVLNIGAVGIKGSRAGNFAMQNADLLLILGCSLGAPIIGYDPQQFNPNSKKIMVDIDKNEMNKDIIHIDYKVHSDLNSFFENML